MTVFAEPKTMPDRTVFDAEYYAETYPDVKNALGTDEAALHNYYKNIPDEWAAMADGVAEQIADSIMANQDYKTDCQKISAAAQIVAGYCNQCAYGSNAGKWYRLPFGVFVGGVYTCAGSTRALRRVLDYMGYSWQHTNENQNKHQWCVVTMDGQVGYADGMGGFAGYGEMKSGMTLSNGTTIYFSE